MQKAALLPLKNWETVLSLPSGQPLPAPILPWKEEPFASGHFRSYEILSSGCHGAGIKPEASLRFLFCQIYPPYGYTSARDRSDRQRQAFPALCTSSPAHNWPRIHRVKEAFFVQRSPPRHLLWSVFDRSVRQAPTAPALP